MSKKRAIIIGVVLVLLYLLSLSPRLMGCHDGDRVTEPGCAGSLGCLVSSEPLRADELHSACWNAQARRLEIPVGDRTCTVRVLPSEDTRVRTLSLTVIEGRVDLELTPEGDGPGSMEIELRPVRNDDRLQVYEAGATIRAGCIGVVPCRLRIE